MGELLTGLPRPMVIPAPRYETDPPGHALPLPWINGEAPPKDQFADFYAFHDECARAANERLCCICGDPLNRYVAVAAMSGGRQTSGGWGHPRCIQISVRMCPHFAKIEGTVAWFHDGDGVGIVLPATFEVDEVLPTTKPMDRTDLAWLAKTNPWGVDDAAGHSSCTATPAPETPANERTAQ